MSVEVKTIDYTFKNGLPTIEVTDDGTAIMSQIPSTKHFSPWSIQKYYSSTTLGLYFYLDGEKQGTSDGQCAPVCNIPSTENADGTYSISITCVKGDDFLYLYGNGDDLPAIIVTMDDGTELFVGAVANYNGLAFYTINKAEGTTLPIAFKTNAPNGYVALCPLIFNDNSIGKAGAKSKNVFYATGVNRIVNGEKINGHTYYGYENKSRNIGLFCRVD